MNEVTVKRKSSNESEVFEDKVNSNEDEKQISINDVIDELGFGKFQIKMAFYCGLTYLIDGMEVMVLSILSLALSCDWMITSVDKALISTFIFIGSGIGSVIWGKIADVYGRKIGLFFTIVFTSYFGILSGLSPTLNWVIILRFLVGIGVGGIPLAFAVYSEFVPKNMRVKSCILLSLFWPVGTIIETGIAILVMPRLNWNWLLIFTTFPTFISMITFKYIPESVRFQLLSGKDEEAMVTIKSIAKMNKKELPIGKIVSGTVGKLGKTSDLFSNEHRWNTLILWAAWFIGNFSYYGIVLLGPELATIGNACGVSSTTKNDCNMHCLKQQDYYNNFYAATAEFPGILILVYLGELVGRKPAIIFSLLGFSICTFALNLCIDVSLINYLVIGARFFISGLMQLWYLYTPEYYPTSIRATGLGICFSFSRLGCMLTPFVAQVLIKQSPHLAITIYASLTFIIAILVFLLPETKGKGLRD